MSKKLNNTQKLIAQTIPNIPNFPIKGIQFKDVTPILLKPKVLKATIDEMARVLKKYKFDYIVAPESRGFFFGIPLAYKLNIPFVPIRKKGKLPREKISVTEKIEYAEVTLEMHKNDIKKNSKVLIVDDLIATGGTILAITKMLKLLKVKPVAAIFVVELPELNGRKVLTDQNIAIEALLELPGK